MTRKSEKGYLYSHMIKPITVARHQVRMKRITCAIERMEMLISINMEGRAEVMFLKAMVTERGEGGSKRWSNDIIW